VISLYDWQAEDVDTIEANNFVAPLIVETGGGKTLMTAEAMKRANPGVTLIIAPESAHNTAWVPTVRDVTGQEVRRVGNKLRAHQRALSDLEWGKPGVYITTPQFVSRSEGVVNWHGDMLVADEHHKLATPKSSGQKRTSGFYPKDYPLSQRFGARLGLSGTPMRQDFSNMWALMRFLWPEKHERHEVAYDNFYLWQMERMDFTEIYTNQKDSYGNTKKAKQFLRETNPGQLLSEMPCYIMHKMRDNCCAYHPHGFMPTEKPQVIERLVTLTAKQKKYIRELEKHYMTWIEDHPLAIDLPIVMKQRLRQICLGEPMVETYLAFDKDGQEVEKETLSYEKECASPFLEECIDIIEQLPEGENVVVYLTAQRFAHVLVDRLNRRGRIRAAEYSGKHKADLTKFGTEYNVLVGQVTAMGAGTDGLQKVCNTEIWMEQPVSITDKTQAEARLDRIGGKQVQRYVLLDDLGMMEGRMGENLEKALSIRASLTRQGGPK
jgi:hypothetical protein